MHGKINFTPAIFWILLLSLSFHPLLAKATAEVPELNTDCQERSTPIPYKFCLFRTEGSSNKDVVYFFHGLGLDERTWVNKNDFAYLVRQHWQETKTAPPTIVSISFGPLWLLVEKNQLPDSGLFEVMTRLVLPEIEGILGNREGQRILLGTSMGGFNAAQLLFKQRDYFKKVALVCPAISSLSPFSTEEEILSFIDRTRSNPEQVRKAIQLSRYFIPSEEVWGNTSPLKLAQKGFGPNPPLIYLTGSLQDEYGFYEGTRLFFDAFQEKGMKLEWRPLSGGHCSIDVVSLAEFLAPSV